MIEVVALCDGCGARSKPARHQPEHCYECGGGVAYPTPAGWLDLVMGAWCPTCAPGDWARLHGPWPERDATTWPRMLIAAVYEAAIADWVSDPIFPEVALRPGQTMTFRLGRHDGEPTGP